MHWSSVWLCFVLVSYQTILHISVRVIRNHDASLAVVVGGGTHRSISVSGSYQQLVSVLFNPLCAELLWEIMTMSPFSVIAWHWNLSLVGEVLGIYCKHFGDSSHRSDNAFIIDTLYLAHAIKLWDDNCKHLGEKMDVDHTLKTQ